MPGAAQEKFRVPASTEHLSLVRDKVRGCARLAGVPEKIASQVVLASDEAVTNVIRHSPVVYGRPKDPDINAAYFFMALISGSIPRSSLIYEGKVMLIAQITSPSGPNTGAATHMIPRVISSLSMAYPRSRIKASSRLNISGSVDGIIQTS